MIKLLFLLLFIRLSRMEDEADQPIPGSLTMLLLSYTTKDISKPIELKSDCTKEQNYFSLLNDLIKQAVEGREMGKRNMKENSELLLEVFQPILREIERKSEIENLSEIIKSVLPVKLENIQSDFSNSQELIPEKSHDDARRSQDSHNQQKSSIDNDQIQLEINENLPADSSEHLELYDKFIQEQNNIEFHSLSQNDGELSSMETNSQNDQLLSEERLKIEMENENDAEADDDTQEEQEIIQKFFEMVDGISLEPIENSQDLIAVEVKYKQILTEFAENFTEILENLHNNESDEEVYVKEETSQNLRNYLNNLPKVLKQLHIQGVDNIKYVLDEYLGKDIALESPKDFFRFLLSEAEISNNMELLEGENKIEEKSLTSDINEDMLGDSSNVNEAEVKISNAQNEFSVIQENKQGQNVQEDNSNINEGLSATNEDIFYAQSVVINSTQPLDTINHVESKIDQGSFQQDHNDEEFRVENDDADMSNDAMHDVMESAEFNESVHEKSLFDEIIEHDFVQSDHAEDIPRIEKGISEKSAEILHDFMTSGEIKDAVHEQSIFEVYSDISESIRGHDSVQSDHAENIPRVEKEILEANIGILHDFMESGEFKDVVHDRSIFEIQSDIDDVNLDHVLVQSDHAEEEFRVEDQATDSSIKIMHDVMESAESNDADHIFDVQTKKNLNADQQEILQKDQIEEPVKFEQETSKSSDVILHDLMQSEEVTNIVHDKKDEVIKSTIKSPRKYSSNNLNQNDKRTINAEITISVNSNEDHQSNAFEENKILVCDDLVCPSLTKKCKYSFKALPPTFVQSVKTSECLDKFNKSIKINQSIIDSKTPGRFFRNFVIKDVEEKYLNISFGDFFIPDD